MWISPSQSQAPVLLSKSSPMTTVSKSVHLKHKLRREDCSDDVTTGRRSTGEARQSTNGYIPGRHYEVKYNPVLDGRRIGDWRLQADSIARSGMVRNDDSYSSAHYYERSSSSGSGSDGSMNDDDNDNNDDAEENSSSSSSLGGNVSSSSSSSLLPPPPRRKYLRRGSKTPAMILVDYYSGLRRYNRIHGMPNNDLHMVIEPDDNDES